MSMTDPVDPIPPATPAPVSGTKSTSTGLPSNVAAALACIPLIGGIIFYVLEKHDQFVRFYAMQSIIFGGAWIVFTIIWNVLFGVLAHIPAIGWVFADPLADLGGLEHRCGDHLDHRNDQGIQRGALGYPLHRANGPQPGRRDVG